MLIGFSLLLIAAGAILSFAVSAQVAGIDLDIVGYVLMGVGVVGLLWALLTMNRNRVSETRTVSDPATGERVTRSRVDDGL